MKGKIISIEITYEDHSRVTFNTFELQKLESLEQAIGMIERARMVYANLKPLFKK